MDMPVLSHEQKRAVLVRLGVPAQVARGMAPKTLSHYLNQQYALPSMRLRVEFEALRQVGRAWDEDELK